MLRDCRYQSPRHTLNLWLLSCSARSPPRRHSRRNHSSSFPLSYQTMMTSDLDGPQPISSISSLDNLWNNVPDRCNPAHLILLVFFRLLRSVVKELVLSIFVLCLVVGLFFFFFSIHQGCCGSCLSANDQSSRRSNMTSSKHCSRICLCSCPCLCRTICSSEKHPDSAGQKLTDASCDVELIAVCACLSSSIPIFSVSHVVNRAPLRIRCCFSDPSGNIRRVTSIRIFSGKISSLTL